MARALLLYWVHSEKNALCGVHSGGKHANDLKHTMKGSQG